MAISFDSPQIAALGVHIAFALYLSSFQANDLASWHIAVSYKYVYLQVSAHTQLLLENNFFKEHSINSRKPLLLLLSPKSYIVLHRIPPFVYISPQFLFGGVLFCSSGS